MKKPLKQALLLALAGVGGAVYIAGVFPLIYLAACRAAERAPGENTAMFLCAALCVGAGVLYLYAAFRLGRRLSGGGHAALFGGAISSVVWLWLLRRLDLMNPERLWERAVNRLGPVSPGEINDLATAYARPFSVLIIALMVLLMAWLFDMVLMLFARYRREREAEEAEIAAEEDEDDEYDEEDEYEDEDEEEEGGEEERDPDGEGSNKRPAAGDQKPDESPADDGKTADP
ncbi:MAG: hypothetical protein J6125_00505 [Clostridia bacterium]|nr:hypothetical protein [Clostridia bacterium]